MRHSVLLALALFACDSTPPAKADATKKADAKKTDEKPTDGKKPDTKVDEGKAPKPAPKAFAKDDKAAVLAAYKAATGTDLGDDVCVEWPSSFPRVTLVGGFAHDRGCDLDGVFIDGELKTADADQLGLATRDYEKAVLADKEAIARAWVDEVLHAFGGGFVTASTTAFEIAGSPKFEAPRATENKIGGVVVEGWVQQPSGMVWESSFDYRIYRISPKGAIEAETRNSFTVPGEKLRDAEAKAGK